jgi:hypothetical protein
MSTCQLCLAITNSLHRVMELLPSAFFFRMVFLVVWGRFGVHHFFVCIIHPWSRKNVRKERQVGALQTYPKNIHALDGPKSSKRFVFSAWHFNGRVDGKRSYSIQVGKKPALKPVPESNTTRPINYSYCVP